MRCLPAVVLLFIALMFSPDTARSSVKFGSLLDREFDTIVSILTNAGIMCAPPKSLVIRQIGEYGYGRLWFAGGGGVATVNMLIPDIKTVDCKSNGQDIRRRDPNSFSILIVLLHNRVASIDVRFECQYSTASYCITTAHGYGSIPYNLADEYKYLGNSFRVNNLALGFADKVINIDGEHTADALNTVVHDLSLDCQRTRSYPGGARLAGRHTCYLFGRPIPDGYHIWSVIQPGVFSIPFFREREFVINISFVHNDLTTSVYIMRKGMIDEYRADMEKKVESKRLLRQRERESRERLFFE